MDADTKDEDTELAIVDMLRYCIEHADRNLPFNQNYLLQVGILDSRIFASLYANCMFPLLLLSLMLQFLKL